MKSAQGREQQCEVVLNGTSAEALNGTSAEATIIILILNTIMIMSNAILNTTVGISQLPSSTTSGLEVVKSGIETIALKRCQQRSGPLFLFGFLVYRYKHRRQKIIVGYTGGRKHMYSI